ncbi:cell division protein FtsB [Pseudomonas sp. SORGH_AS199]|nr:cell division protein FtsB [Pseudomonas sp. SORGH_AS_0199]
MRVRASFLAVRADCLQRLGGAAWLLAISILIVHDHMGQSRLRQQLAQHDDQPGLYALQADMAALTARLDALPTPEHLVSPTELSAVREDLKASLATIVQRQEKHAQAADVLTLQQRTDRLEAQLHALMHQATASHEKSRTPARPAPKAKASEPPFHLLGAEQRGGHSFLSLLPAHQQGLNAVTLLRVGESLDHWQLTGLTQNTATFRVDGQVRDLPLPGGDTR